MFLASTVCLPYITTNFRKVAFIAIIITDDKTKNQKGSLCLNHEDLLPPNLKQKEKWEEIKEQRG